MLRTILQFFLSLILELEKIGFEFVVGLTQGVKQMNILTFYS